LFIQAVFVRLHIAAGAVADHDEDLPVARTVIPGIVSEIRRSSSRESHRTIPFACRPVTRSAITLEQLSTFLDRGGIRRNRILELLGLGMPVRSRRMDLLASKSEKCKYACQKDRRFHQAAET